MMGKTINMHILLFGAALCLLSTHLLSSVIFIPRIYAFEGSFIVYPLAGIVLIEMCRKTFSYGWQEILAGIGLVVVGMGVVDLIFLTYLVSYKTYIVTRPAVGVVALIVIYIGSILNLLPAVRLSSKLMLRATLLLLFVGLVMAMPEIFSFSEAYEIPSVFNLMKQAIVIWVAPYIFLLILWKRWKQFS